MSRYRARFPGRQRVLLPVVHVETWEQTERNVAVARDAGADGVFLIAHSAPHQVLLDITRRICESYPGWFVGVNCLDLQAHEVIGLLPPGVAGIWSDNAGNEERFAAERERHDWNGLYFGGVAFKYQHLVGTPAQAAAAAMEHMDVICTSGPGTAMAMDAQKGRDMRGAIGDHPLAVASGVTCENVADYLPYVDAFLVASGIGKSFEELDPDKVERLADIIHGWRPA